MPFCIEDELKKLPVRSGVYLMHDASDEIIYVGKARSLRNRVRQYFQSSRNKGPKIEKMVPQIARFEYIVTDSELEALILECNLIKEHRPKYNTLLKDDKTYPYIRVTLEEDFPKILFSRKIRKDRSKYFGPYTSAGSVKEAIELIRKLYRIRSCTQKLPASGKTRPCLYYHIHQCDAPCQGYISKEDYRRNVDAAIDFINGNHGDIIQELTSRMKAASEAMNFEEAAGLRDMIESVKRIAQSQKAAVTPGEDWDIIALVRKDTDAIAQVFYLRNGKLIGREHYYLKTDELQENSEILKSFIMQFYSGTDILPKTLMLSEETDDADLIEEWLSKKRGSRVSVVTPKKGKKEKLVELALQNARIVLEQDAERVKKEEKKTVGAAVNLGRLIGIPMPHRIEAYDISNISGFQAVGSMVVFENGRNKRSDYRKFRIKTVEGPNDYASLEEVLNRRFERAENKSPGFSVLPDLILMDGGRGQVNICSKVLKEHGLDIHVCGMVKDDHHRTRGLYYNNKEIEIDPHSPEFALITRIQDEAHRFAITYHRMLRGKGQVHSILDDIEGIGPARRKELMSRYAGIDEIKNASVDELAELGTMNRRSAQAVYDFFNGKGEKDGRDNL
ncbi:MAG: excinuclease ABC subunit UvrC [Lachnospiraceae bacterium]|nr:excinuclease ABC subunit UvrC [Lachnospiraceae bacterium]